MSRIASVVVAWATALVVALGTGIPAVAAEVTHDRKEGVYNEAAMVPAEAAEPEAVEEAAPEPEPVTEAAAETDAEHSIKERAPGVSTQGQMPQFQLPQPSHVEEGPRGPTIQRLKYQYSFGSESEIQYRRNPDLNSRVQDNFLLLVPQLNGFVVHRPTDWLATTLELVLDYEIPVQEQKVLLLPSGETQYAPKRGASLLVDQGYVTIRPFTSFELNVGRRNYEDERHWWYDTSMDIASISLKTGSLRTEVFVGREVLCDLDLHGTQKKTMINNYTLIADYRGIEDIRLTGYTVYQVDLSKKLGRPVIMGLSANGMPSDKISFWTTLAMMRGTDEQKKSFSAYAYDVGGTYRFTDLPLRPSITLGYAFATGDLNPNDNKNTEFRQTGLESNEAKFAGVSVFKVYGETLDPELSNLKILTAGLGFRPAPNVSVDFVYHRYRLDEIADETRNSALTAQMNQDDTQFSKNMGSEFDLIVGIRNLFGIRRLGLDLRFGWFFPGKAFRNEEGTPDTPTFRHADNGSSIVAKFWY